MNPHIPLLHHPAHPRIDLPEDLLRNLRNLAVVGEKAVQFVLDVGQLGVDGGGKSLFTSRQDPIGARSILGEVNIGNVEVTI